MRQFKSNKLPYGFENEWNRRLVEGGDRCMLRNLNDFYVQRTVHLKVDKMTYFSFATFWNKKKYFANGDFRNGEYLRLCKNGLLDEYKEQNKCNKAECFSSNTTRRRLLVNLQNSLTN